MRIAHIANSFSSRSETFLYDLITTQHDLGHDCHIITFRRLNEIDRPYPENHVHLIDRSAWDVRRYINYMMAYMASRPKETANWDLYRKQIRQKISEIRPDVIHAHFGDMGVLIEPVARELQIPLVVTFHGYDISILPRKEFWAERYRKLFDTAKVVIGVSNHLCDKLEKQGANPRQISMIHNGIDVEKFAPSEYSNSEKGLFRFTFIGRFVEKKGPILLLKSFHHFIQKHGTENVELQMIGDGPLLGKSKSYVRKKGLESFLNFTGFVDHNDIPTLLRASDVYVQHSVTAEDGDEEGMGVTLAEASATQLPVIVTDHNGFPDVILDEETGFLVPERDTEAMGEKMSRLYQDPPLCSQMGKNGRKHIKDNFEKEKQITKVINLYKSIL